MQILRLWNRMTSSDTDYDTLDLLKQDHAVLAELFDRYESLDDLEQKQALISHIIRSLTVHTRIEEELFYPALRRAVGEQALMDDADVEHAMIRMLLADLNRITIDAPHFDAKVRSLAQLVEHHVSEEEGRMFPDARGGDLNLVAMGGQLAAYRAALESRYELDTDGRDLDAFLSTPIVVRIGTAPASASRKPGPKGKSVASAPGGNDKAPRRTNSIATSRQRRTRRSDHTGAEASEGEPT